MVCVWLENFLNDIKVGGKANSLADQASYVGMIREDE